MRAQGHEPPLKRRKWNSMADSSCKVVTVALEVLRKSVLSLWSYTYVHPTVDEHQNFFLMFISSISFSVFFFSVVTHEVSLSIPYKVDYREDSRDFKSIKCSEDKE